MKFQFLLYIYIYISLHERQDCHQQTEVSRRTEGKKGRVYVRTIRRNKSPPIAGRSFDEGKGKGRNDPEGENKNMYVMYVRMCVGTFN